MTSPKPKVVWRDLAFTILVPNALLGAGQGALGTAIPIAAIQMGASFSKASLIAAMLTVGVLVSTLPAGWLVARVSEKWAMFAAGLASLLAALTAFLAPNLGVLVVAVTVMGAGTSVFAMGRHTWVTTSTPAVNSRTRHLDHGRDVQARRDGRTRSWPPSASRSPMMRRRPS